MLNARRTGTLRPQLRRRAVITTIITKVEVTVLLLALHRALGDKEVTAALLLSQRVPVLRATTRRHPALLLGHLRACTGTTLRHVRQNRSLIPSYSAELAS